MDRCGRIVSALAVQRNVRPPMNLFELLPLDIALVCIGNQHKPALARFVMASMPRFAIFVLGHVLGFTVSICPTIGRISEHLVDGLIRWTLPIDLAVLCLDWQLEIVLQKPQQGLPNSSQFRKLAIYG